MKVLRGNKQQKNKNDRLSQCNEILLQQHHNHQQHDYRTDGCFIYVSHVLLRIVKETNANERENFNSI